MHLSGKTINLILGDYTATIVTMGGAIAALKYRGHDITMPFNPETIPQGHNGKILAPWPNRLQDGKYTFDNQEYQLPVNDLVTNSASHGLVAWRDWTVSDLRASSATLKAYINPVYSYPFLIKMVAHYELIEGMGLKVDITALNAGKKPAPYGIGMHPYITCDNAPLSECQLTMPFKEV